MSKVGISQSIVNAITEKYVLHSDNLLIASISYSNKYLDCVILLIDEFQGCKSKHYYTRGAVMLTSLVGKL